ncbi:histone-lysine N-methyltransferase, H3 lysine-79 specific-like [Macrobrachium rosenbergii]|uniref:histone-lysine N-methyltransferase, H3 lysine-79 specific-like n=1 Tax=Macrobrachium rosenbergii TaxID=79674 RepID=UPI0034D57D91
MEDNISFEDEVNTIPRTHNFVSPSSTATAVSLYDNNNSANNSDNNNSHYNNNLNPASGTSPDHSPVSNERYRSNENATVPAAASVFFKGSSSRRDRETSLWLTRSVTQPNLCSREDAMSLAAASAGVATIPSASTQSAESVLRLPDSKYGCSQVTTSDSALSSCPSSYEGLSGGTSSEFFDARSSLSAPVELLSEFLSALMSRDYADALNLCQSILKYEPQNATALEFYPLLLTKIKQGKDDHPSTSDDDTNEDSDELDKDDDEEEEEEEEEEAQGGKEEEVVATSDDEEEEVEEERKGDNKHAKKSEAKKQIRSSSADEHPRVLKPASLDGVARKTPPGSDHQTAFPFYPSVDMSTSNSMDFSVEIDSGRDSLFTPSDSDLNLESGDSLYSSTDSNLNIVRSGSDSLFSSTETGLTLDAVIQSIQNLGVKSKQQAIK